MRVTTEVLDPVKARTRSVMVVTDVFMNDTVEAERLAGLIRSEFTAEGFKVHETESEAELIVIPTLEHSKPADAGAATSPNLRRAWRWADFSYGLRQANMMESENAIRTLGFEFDRASPAGEGAKAGLVVTAVPREAWVTGWVKQKKEIPKVWRITAISPLKKDQDVTAPLVEAVGSKLSQITSAKTEATEKPAPTTDSTRKKAAASP